MAILRRESWSKEVDWGVTSMVILIREGEVVHISDEVMTELGLTLGDHLQGVENESFYHAVPYTIVRDELHRQGFAYEGDVDASTS